MAIVEDPFTSSVVWVRPKVGRPKKRKTESGQTDTADKEKKEKTKVDNTNMLPEAAANLFTHFLGLGCCAEEDLTKFRQTILGHPNKNLDEFRDMPNQIYERCRRNMEVHCPVREGCRKKTVNIVSDGELSAVSVCDRR